MPANTKFYTNFAADGHITSNSTGKVFTIYPRGGFPVDYRIVDGNIVKTVDYGNVVAKIKMKKDGTFKIYDCASEGVANAIGYKWVPENIHSY